MVVMRARTGHVRVLARGQVEPFDDTEVGQQVECPKQGRSTDPEPSIAGGCLELGGREMAVVLGDEVRDRAPGPVSR